MRVILSWNYFNYLLFNDEVKSFNFKMGFIDYDWFNNIYLRVLNGFYNMFLRTYDAHFSVSKNFPALENGQ